jgi:hypothetical protein
MNELLEDLVDSVQVVAAEVHVRVYGEGFLYQAHRHLLYFTLPGRRGAPNARKACAQAREADRRRLYKLST